MDLNKTGVYTLGVDLGGTKLDTALVDSSGTIITNEYRLLGDNKDPDRVIEKLVDAAKLCLNKSGLKASAIGIGVAGQIDREEGLVRTSPNLPEWCNVPLKDRIGQALGLPVYVDNDVHLITCGEWKHGSGRGVDDLVCIIVGTGIGGGIVSKGRLLEGSGYTAGELGHITVVAAGRKCHCPNEGCMEAYAGGWAIAERTQDAIRANPQFGKKMLEIAGDISNVTAITVSEANKLGDPLAHRMIRDTSRYLAAGVVTVVNAFNPGLIIFGGSVILGIPELLPVVQDYVRVHALPTAVEDLRFTTAALGVKAGVIGAAVMARNL